VTAGEFRHIRFGYWNGTIGAQRRDGAVIGRRAIFSENGRAVRGQLPGDIVVILDRDRQARKPARVLARLCSKTFCMLPRFIEETNGQRVNLRFNVLDAGCRGIHELQGR
jgi:hypothetical protein